MVLESTPLDSEGNELVRHELWKKAGGKGERVIFPQHADTHVFSFTVPIEAVSPLRIEADLDFRRYRQEFLDLVLPGVEDAAGVRQPTVTQTSASKILELSGAQAPTSAGEPGALR